jgi:hypothetical protein
MLINTKLETEVKKTADWDKPIKEVKVCNGLRPIK